MRIAVTGASGFCGAAVARAAAAAGADVVCLGRRAGPVGTHVPWDAATGRPDLAGADAVVHLAAAVGDPPPGAAAFAAVNVDGTARLLDAARDRTVVYVSSASVYAAERAPASRARGPVPSGPRSEATREDGTSRAPGHARAERAPASRALAEGHPVGGQRTAYGRTKAAGEALALAAGAVSLRPRAVYGPGDPHLLPRLRRAVRGGVLLLPGPDVPLSLTAVENLADACLAALGWPAGAYNIADATAYRRDATLRAVLAAVGVPVRLMHVPEKLAYAAAAAARLGGRLRRTAAPPVLTRYAVDQLAHGVVLDTRKALGQGWRPRRSLADFLAARGGDAGGGN